MAIRPPSTATPSSPGSSSTWSSHPDDRQASRQQLGRAVQKGDDLQGEFRGLPRDGAPRHYATRGLLFRDAAACCS